MILHDVSLYGSSGLWNIIISGETIKRVSQDPIPPGQYLEIDGALALPGFINSHDHLDFNVYPQLGHDRYDNYRIWGPEIQKEYSTTINAVLRIPAKTRTRWGLYKNLLNGFTTVVNHGKKLKIEDDLVTVIQNTTNLHSVAFEKNWARKLANPFSRKKVIMHLGEGTDKAAMEEIDEVIRKNIFRKKIMAVHGVAMKQEQALHFAGLIWCPASNYFMLDKTANITSLRDVIPVVFGSDSTLTSPWNIWEHLRMAAGSGLVTEKELVNMLTTSAAAVWGLSESGAIEAGRKADIVVMNKKENIFANNPEDVLLVIQKGKIRLIDVIILKNNRDLELPGFFDLEIKGRRKKVQGDVVGLIAEIKDFFPNANNPLN